VGPVPSADHRRALQLATLVRQTTEDLLSGVFRADAHGLFEWLRRQPYILEGDHGLAPDELVRELVEIDLRWRDRLGYAELQRRATSQLLKRIAAHTHDVDAVL